ncbi:MAG: hypothetical protein GY708_07175, partial [Actinomycetia bacterium]|nr:hypothetical protein [Actinomycetes bacterium]
AIAAPADLAVITEPTEIIGTVDSDRLDSWTLTSRPIGDGETVTLASGNAPVAGSTLATFDPTLLLNGLYEIELTATDVQSQQVSESIAISVEGQMKIGHFTLSFLDLAILVSGLDIEIMRTYDSRDNQPRDFGVGWSLDIRQGSYRNNRPPGDGWQLLQTGLVACDTALESKSHLTIVRLSDQEVYRFALRLYGGAPSASGGCYANARFDFINGPLPGTMLEILGNDQVFYETGSDRVIDIDTLETYQPQDVRLTTRDGRIFELDLNDGVTLVEDLNGNQLSITPAGITHSSGKGIVFERDAEDRIAGITDPRGTTMTYAYDAAGNLVSFTDRAGAFTRFGYADHLLIDIEDPRGVFPIRNDYDDNGRIIRHTDSSGQVSELSHDLDARQEIVTNRLGHSRLLEYDSRGNVVRVLDELGKETIRTYDERDNLLSDRDPLGRTTTFNYSANNDFLSQKDPLDNETTYTYNSRGQLLTITDPRGNVTSNVYDANGNLTSTTDTLGNATSLTYDDAGNLLTATDAASQVTTFEYDLRGHRTKAIDALGNETISTYDANGNRVTETKTRTMPDSSSETLVTTFAYDALDRVTTVTAADGSTTSVTYDLLGKVTSRTDALGRVTSMTYDDLGRLVRTDYPDGTNGRQSFDAEGRILSQVDRADRSTTFTHDALSRLMSMTSPDGASISYTYDDASQLVAKTDARGNTTQFIYDEAGRRTAVIDPLGNGPTFVYDGNGNQTSVTDARGNTTTFVYDDSNRLTTTTFPDGATANVLYDNLDRRVGGIDQAGLTTEFGYDAVGRLVSVTDALDQVTSYTYDEVGNRLTQTDTNGRTTRFEYDRLGRQTARIFPDSTRETMVYNPDGTLASHTNFSGDTRTYKYDANQRAIKRIYPDSSEVNFSFTATGQRASTTDSRGTTSYEYDDRDRLLRRTDPTGYTLAYTYDLEGNRTSLTATVGAQVFTTTYSYDQLNRLETVTDSQGGVNSLTYDENGNRASLAYPTAVTTDYTYDQLNRLIHLDTTTSIGTVLQDYAYTLGATGHRTRIDEHDGTSRNYIYDNLYRLTQDRVTDPADTLIYQRDFQYDPAANRVQQTIDEGPEPTVVSSTYDSRDRLLTAAGTDFSWDANGNLISRDGTSYGWDFDNRLTSVSLDNGSLVETTYDADGHRVQTAVTPPGGATTTVDYLVDTAGTLSHVVAEVGGGAVQTLYTRAGDQLIALYRPASEESKYYHADGLGSVRALSDETGSVSDRYSYTAFGELLEHTGADPQSYQFAGEPFDPDVGLAYHRARWMNPEAGLFAATDPVLGFLYSPSSLSRYHYSNADPVNGIDPSGLFGFSLAESLTVLAAGQVEIPKTVDLRFTNHLPRLYSVDTFVLEFEPDIWEAFEPYTLTPVAEDEKILTRNLVRAEIERIFSPWGVAVQIGNIRGFVKTTGNVRTRGVKFVKSKGFFGGLGITPILSAAGKVRVSEIVESEYGTVPGISRGRNGEWIPQFRYVEVVNTVAQLMTVVATHELLRTVGYLGSLGNCQEFFMCESVLETDSRLYSFHPSTESFLNRVLVPHE